VAGTTTLETLSSAAWDPLPKENIKKLETVLRRAARYVLKVAKCNLGKVHLEWMCPVVFLTNMHVGRPQGFASPCADISAVFTICSSFAIMAVFLQCFASNFTATAWRRPCLLLIPRLLHLVQLRSRIQAVHLNKRSRPFRPLFPALPNCRRISSPP